VSPVAVTPTSAAVSAIARGLDLIARRQGVVTAAEWINGVVRDAESYEIVAPAVGFIERVADADDSRNPHRRRQAALVECRGVIESGAKHRGGPAIVLRGAENHDGVGAGGLVMRGLDRDRHHHHRPY